MGRVRKGHTDGRVDMMPGWLRSRPATAGALTAMPFAAAIGYMCHEWRAGVWALACWWCGMSWVYKHEDSS
jgi:hypothetical protein